jgi:hypothetical protein
MFPAYSCFLGDIITPFRFAVLFSSMITANTFSHGFLLTSLRFAYLLLGSVSGFLLACLCWFLLPVIMTVAVIMGIFLGASTFLCYRHMLQTSIAFLGSIITAVFNAPLRMSSTHTCLLGNVITLLLSTDLTILAFGLLGAVFDANTSVLGLVGAIRYIALATATLLGRFIFSR